MKKSLMAIGLASALLLSACTTDGKMSESKEENFLSSILNNQQIYSQMTILGPRVEDNIDKLSEVGANELMFFYFDLMQSTASNANQMGMYYYQDALKDLASGKTVEKIDLEALTNEMSNPVVEGEEGSEDVAVEPKEEKEVKYQDLNDKKFLKKIKDPDFKKLMEEVYASNLIIKEENGFFTFEINFEWLEKEFKGQMPAEMVTFIEFYKLQESQEMYSETGTMNFDSLISLVEFVKPLLEGYDNTYYASTYKSQIGVYYSYLLGLYESSSLDENGKYNAELIAVYDKISADKESPIFEETKAFIAALKKNEYVPNEETTSLMDKILLNYMTQEYLDSYKSSNIPTEAVEGEATDDVTITQTEVPTEVVETEAVEVIETETTETDKDKE